MLHLITGGSGSGKSAFAESQILDFEEGHPRFYIATMFPFDAESHKRIKRHREMRKEKKFTTIECYTNLKEISIPPKSHVLLECMSNLTANEMYQENGAKEKTVDAILQGVTQLYAQAEHLVIVTNEIFSDGIEYDAETKRYQQYLGLINARLAAMADHVTEVVYTIPIRHK